MGWAGRETLGGRPPGRGGRAGGQGSEASSARMRNKAVGQARAPPARPTGGLRAGPAAAVRGRPAGPMPAGAEWAGGRGLHPPRVLVTALVLTPRLGSPPPEVVGGRALGVPRHVPPRGGVRGRRPSEEVGRPRAAQRTRGAAVVSKMR